MLSVRKALNGYLRGSIHSYYGCLRRIVAERTNVSDGYVHYVYIFQMFAAHVYHSLAKGRYFFLKRTGIISRAIHVSRFIFQLSVAHIYHPGRSASFVLLVQVSSHEPPATGAAAFGCYSWKSTFKGSLLCRRQRARRRPHVFLFQTSFGGVEVSFTRKIINTFNRLE